MICIPIMAEDNEEALEKMRRGADACDLFEIRLDRMGSFHLEGIIHEAPRPVMITYRSKKEGGKGGVDYGTRIHYLSRALQAGAAFVDVEFSMPLEFRRELFSSATRSSRVLSAHLLNGTPRTEDLERLLRKMAAQGSEIVKIVTRARQVEDNLRLMNLIPLAKSLGVEVIPFCMGPLGRLSRIAAPLLGGFLTFASLEAGEESADGQLPARELKTLLERLVS
jgi:3-dehydroquinate dehydratase type I